MKKCSRSLKDDYQTVGYVVNNANELVYIVTDGEGNYYYDDISGLCILSGFTKFRPEVMYMHDEPEVRSAMEVFGLRGILIDSRYGICAISNLDPLEVSLIETYAPKAMQCAWDSDRFGDLCTELAEDTLGETNAQSMTSDGIKAYETMQSKILRVKPVKDPLLVWGIKKNVQIQSILDNDNSEEYIQDGIGVWAHYAVRSMCKY